MQKKKINNKYEITVNKKNHNNFPLLTSSHWKCWLKLGVPENSCF